MKDTNKLISKKKAFKRLNKSGKHECGGRCAYELRRKLFSRKNGCFLTYE